MTYTATAQSQIYLNTPTTKTALQSAVSGLDFPGSSTATSNLSAALFEARTVQFSAARGDRPGVQNIVIVVTDGFDASDSQRGAIAEANATKAQGTVIYGVGVGNRALENADTFGAIVSRPLDLQPSFYTATDYAALDNDVTISDAIYRRVCTASAHSDCSSKVMDLVFVLDRSSNVGSSGWTSILDAVNQMVDALDVGPSATHVGVVTFGRTATTNIFLTAYSDKGQLTNAIGRLPFLNSGSDVDFYSALQTAQATFAGGLGGGRPDVPHAVVLITGSSSTVNQAMLPAVSRQLRRNGILVYAVGIGTRINRTELQTVSSHPHLLYHQWWTVSDFAASFLSTVNGIIGEICKPPLEFFCRLTQYGGYQCFCPLDECNIQPVNGTECQDVNECQIDNGGCSDICNNSAGSFVCACRSGLQLSNDGRTCEDVNECTNGNPCAQGSRCINAWATFYCLSNSAFPDGGSAAAALSNPREASLTGVDAAVVGLASAVAVVLAAVSLIGTVAAVRFCRHRRRRHRVTASASKHPTAARSTLYAPSSSGSFGSSVASRYSLPPTALGEEWTDTISTTS